MQGDRGFESTSLQQGICKPSVPRGGDRVVRKYATGSGSTASQNHPRLRPLRRQIPIVARRSPPSRGFVHRRLSDAGPYTGSIARAGPPSETLPDSRPSGPARNGKIQPFPGGSRRGVRRFSKASIRSGNLLKPRPHGSRAECVFVDLAVLHDHMKVLRRMRHELNVLKGISADNQKIGKRALLDDAQLSGIRIAWTG